MMATDTTTAPGVAAADVTAALARFVFETDQLPDAAWHAGRRTVLNTVALAVGASDHPAVAIARRAVGPFVGRPTASVLGRAERSSPMWAALLNGMAAHVEDFDDTHLATVVHPGAPIVPAALAVGEDVGATGRDTVLAAVLGIEVALRVGLALGRGHFDRGWHLTGTMGHLGAAAAAGRLLGLDRDELVVALGLAATQAAGLQAALGTMTKSFHPGKAAADGIEAALLARAGFTGPARPIEGRRGLAALAAPTPDPAVALRDLGHRWEVVDNAFKPYACGIVSHPVIDGGIAMRGRVAPEEVAAVTVRVNPVVLDVMGIADPQDGLQSKFSVYHCFAIGLLAGAAGPAQFSTATTRDPQVVALRRLVTAEPDADIARDEAFVKVTTTDGRALAHHVEHATASAARPMTDAQLRDKARLVAAPVLGDDGVDRLVAAAFALDAAPDLAALTTVARPSD